MKIGLISFRPLLFFLPFSISFCFRWFRFAFVGFLLFRFVSFRFRWFRFVSFRFYFVSHLIGTSQVTRSYDCDAHILQKFCKISVGTVLFLHVNLPAGAFFSRFWGSLPSLPSTFKIFRPWKKSSTKKILTYILRSIFLEIPHLELPRWRNTPRDTNGKGEYHIQWYPVIDLFDTFYR